MTARDDLLNVFLEATDDLPDDAGDGIDAILAHPELLLEAIGAEPVPAGMKALAFRPNSVYRVLRTGETR